MITDNFIVAQIGKAAVIGTAIVFSTNIACFAVCYSIVNERQPSSITQILVIILGIIAIADIGVGYFLKRQLLKPVIKPDVPPNEKYLGQVVLKITIIISALSAASAVYGMVAVFLGANFEIMVGFIIVSLAGFMLLRLRPRDFENLHGMMH